MYLTALYNEIMHNFQLFKCLNFVCLVNFNFCTVIISIMQWWTSKHHGSIANCLPIGPIILSSHYLDPLSCSSTYMIHINTYVTCITVPSILAIAIGYSVLHLFACGSYQSHAEILVFVAQACRKFLSPAGITWG